MKRPMIGAAAVLALTAGAAVAQDLDSDGDGAISLMELRAVFPSTTEEDFAAADADSDGRVSGAELWSAIAAGVVLGEG